MHKRDSSSFVFTYNRVLVCPELEVMAKARVVMVVYEDISLASIAFPPLVLRLYIEIRIILSRVMGFTSARGAIDPNTTDGITSIGWLTVDKEGINRGAGGLIFTDIDIALGDSFLEAEFKDGGISSSKVSLDITFSRSDSKLIRSF